MIRKIVVSFFFLILFFPQVLCAEKIWQDANSGLTDLDIRTVSVFPGDGQIICAASAKIVYLSQNSGEDWSGIFSLAAEEDEINFVKFHFSDSRILYVATTEGLFITADQGQTWQRIFRRVRDEANNVQWIALDAFNDKIIYIGTEFGLYVSGDSGATWRKCGGGLPDSSVSSIAVHPANSCVLYLANTYGLYKSQDTGVSWKRTYVTSHRISDEEEDEEEESEQETLKPNLINCIAIDQGNPKRIFFATGEGVFVSFDSGESWSKLPTHGLSNDYVNFIVVAQGKEDAVYAATKNGVFKFLPNHQSWQNTYQGMTARQVSSLSLNKNSRQLFAGTDRGIFRTIENKYLQRKNEEQPKVEEDKKIDFEQVLQELYLNEPTIGAVQEAALRYAEVVHPERIKILRRNAKLKALLPDVTLDYDKTVDEGTAANFGRFIIGPRDWSLNLSWDIGDLVYSEQVRLIDSNARLMVQLRDDILNEVTRLYYQRRKLQTELILTPPQTPEEKLTKGLRLEELTANIDALTGGFFSRGIRNYK